MSGPFAEGGPLPPVDPEELAAAERRVSEWEDEIVRRIEQADESRREADE